MASIKAIFRPSTVSGQKGTVYYRIIHERKVRHLPTGYKVHKSEFNHIDTKEKIHRDIERLERIARILDSKGSVYTSGDTLDYTLSSTTWNRSLPYSKVATRHAQPRHTRLHLTVSNNSVWAKI